MQQIFTINEPDDAKRLCFLFPTTDGVAGKTSGVANNKAEIAINDGSFVETTNAIVQFTGGNTKPIYYVQLEADELSELGHGVVFYDDAGSVEFAGIFQIVPSSAELSLDEVMAQINQVRSRLRYIEFLLQNPDKVGKQLKFVDPLYNGRASQS
jgi:hypothetical protein